MPPRIWRARVLLVMLAVVVVASGSIASPAHAIPPQGNPATSASVRTRWPVVDHKAEQAYWAERENGMTGAALLAAEAQAARLPMSSTLPPTNHPSRPVSSIPGGPGGGWTGVGPAPDLELSECFSCLYYYTGRVTALAVDQATSGANTTIYLGSAGGGVWKSTNGGENWASLTDSQPSLAVGAIAIDPNNHNVIYVGTGEPNQSGDSHYGVGVLKSTNDGASWTLYGATQFKRTTITKIIINPRNSNQLWVATTSSPYLNTSLYTSTDGGQTYSLVGGGLPYSYAVWDLGINATTNPVTLYATLSSYPAGSGLFRSTDGGSTWTQETAGLTSVTWNRSALAVAPSNPNILYLVVTGGGSGSDVYTGSYNGGYYSTNGGTSWTQMTSLNQNFVNGGYGSQGWYDLYLGVDPQNDDIVYGGGVDIAVTTDARSATGNWRNITNVYWARGDQNNNSGIHPDQHAIAFPTCSAAPCPAFFGNDGGIFYSGNTTNADPTTVTYTDLNTAGLSISTFTGGDVTSNFANGRLSIGGTQDDGTMIYNGSPIQDWVWGGDGGFAQIDWSNPNIMYAEDSGISLVKSSNIGPWTSATTGLGGGSEFYMPFTLDRQNDQHLVAGTSAVYETINGASSWYQSSQTLPYTVSAVAIAPSNSAVIYAGMVGGYVSMTTHGDTGTSSTYTATNSGLPLPGTDYISSLAVDPADSTGMTAFATNGQFSDPNTGHIFKTTNGGTSWADISGSLGTAIPINASVVYYSGTTRVLVVGTDVGVFYTPNDGAAWYRLIGIPNSPVEQLAVDGARTTIMAFTHGRGEWTIDIPNADPTAGTGDTPGIYRPSTGTFSLRTSLTTGVANETVRFGPIGAGIYPITGDWTGSGVDTPGVYDSNTATFYLASNNTAAPPLLTSFTFGLPGDVPLVGDWNGDGVDGVGVFRPSNGVIYLKNDLSTGYADYSMVFGVPGDMPVAGDWSGQGHATVGIYRPSTHQFYLTNTNCNCIPTVNYVVAFGVAGDVPFTGDWTHSGHTGLGVFRTANGLIYMRKDATTTGFADYSLVLGVANDQPVAGHWI